MKFTTCVTILFPVVAAVATVALAEYYVSPTSPETCGKTCRFTFCPAKADFRFPIGKPDIAVTPAICDASGKVVVGHVGATSEAYVANANTGAIPISSALVCPVLVTRRHSRTRQTTWINFALFCRSRRTKFSVRLAGMWLQTSTLNTIHMSIAWPS
jgi:hypothetical protein